MKFSPWDLPLLSFDSNYSNLQSFLDSVTPTVPATQMHPQQQSPGEVSRKCFSLRELWESYLDKSVYGAGVPLLLNTGDGVVQYYSPSLSAIQIFTRKPLGSFRPLQENDSNIFEIDFDSESEKMSRPSTNNSSRTSDSASDGSAVERDDSCHTMDHFGYLYCQYNETSGPYDRVPFSEKIKELAQKYHGLTRFQSIDLSPYSWMAVAWYPIYQIPVARNVRELSACFLTYHELSSSFSGVTSNPIVDDKLNLFGSVETERRSWPFKGDSRGEVSRSPFAVLTYKMLGEFWMNPEICDQERMMSYKKAASSWLKRLEFQHNDFNFFMSRTSILG